MNKGLLLERGPTVLVDLNVGVSEPAHTGHSAKILAIYISQVVMALVMELSYMVKGSILLHE